jgi:hypothetical protein
VVEFKELKKKVAQEIYKRQNMFYIHKKVNSKTNSNLNFIRKEEEREGRRKKREI